MPVHAAACWAQPDLIELLCEYGGDINAKTNNGETPLGNFLLLLYRNFAYHISYLHISSPQPWVESIPDMWY